MNDEIAKTLLSLEERVVALEQIVLKRAGDSGSPILRRRNRRKSFCCRKVWARKRRRCWRLPIIWSAPAGSLPSMFPTWTRSFARRERSCRKT